MFQNGKALETCSGEVRTSPQDGYRSLPMWRDDHDCKYRPGGPGKIHGAAKRADLRRGINVRKYDHNLYDDFVTRVGSSMHLEMHQAK